MSNNTVIPAKAGTQCVRLRGLPEALDPRLRGDDGVREVAR